MEARSTRRRTLRSFQATLLWMLVQVGLVVAYLKQGAAMPPLLLAGLLAVGIALGLLAGRRFRIPFLFVGAGTAMPGALLPPFLVCTATCFSVVLLGYGGHVLRCWQEGRDVTAHPPREADAPGEVVLAKAESPFPGRQEAKAVPDARLIPRMGRRFR